MWDAGAITGGGYGDTDTAQVDADLDGRGDVVAHGFYAFDPASRFGGAPTPTIYGFAGVDAFPFPVVDGRPAATPGEAVVGTSTRRQARPLDR